MGTMFRVWIAGCMISAGGRALRFGFSSASVGTFPMKNITKDRPACLSSIYPQSRAQRYTGLAPEMLVEGCFSNEFNG